MRTIVLLVLVATVARSQSFTSLASSQNPIVNDLKESGGGSWVDVNNDLLLDLFVAHGNLSQQNNSLYLNTGNGNFIKVNTIDLVNDGGTSIGSTWGDFNTDGWLDCYVVNRNNTGNFLYLGYGDTTFTRIINIDPVTQIANSNSASWVDIDSDGDLDLNVINFQGPDFLFSNLGPFIYDLNSVQPLDTGNQFSIHGIWADYNNDRQPDLFVGNAGLQNDILYTNISVGTFDTTVFQDGKSTLGASWCDFDNDGDLDLFTASFLNEGSILYINNGPPDYSFTAVDTGILSAAGQSIGSAFGDADNDGDADLFVSNDGQNNYYFRNNGPPDYHFTRITTGDFVNDGGHSFGCAFADYDADGHLDLFVANRMNESDFLYHNDGNSNHWITIKCSPGSHNAVSIGTKVRVNALINGVRRWQMQEVAAQSGYNSQNLWLHFGLGDATLADTIVIEWQSGITDTCFAVAADVFYEAFAGSCLSTAIEDHEASILTVYPNPAQDKLFINGNINSKYAISIHDMQGRILLNEENFSGNSIDVSALKKGIYLINVLKNKRSLHTCFIKL